MCTNKVWSVRSVPDRTKYRYYERTAISRKPEETIKGDIMQLMDQGSIHVAQYLTKMPPKKLLEEKLAIAIANAKEQLEQR